MISKNQIITTWLLFCAYLFPQIAAKKSRFSRKNSDFRNTVSFGKKALISFVSDEKEESVVLTKDALVGVGDNSTLEIIVEINDRVPMRGSRIEPSIVLFFAPEDATLTDVSKGFANFNDYVIASLMDKSKRSSNSTSRFLSQTITGETEVQEVEEDFSFLDSGFLKLTREDGYVKAYTSADKDTWNQIGDSQLLPVSLQDANMKAGLRVKRNSRNYYALSVKGRFSYSKYADPLDDPIDEESGPKVYGISLHLNNLCSDSTDGGLSTTLTNDLEHALLDFFNETYAGNQNITYESVMIVGDDFEEGLSCSSLEDDFISAQRRKLPRTVLYSTVYFILNGYCYGSCPSDPSSYIDTVNRRKLQTQSVNEQLLTKVQSVTPDVDAVSKGGISSVDCSLNRNCNSLDGRCCGFDDCFCPYNVIEICDDSYTCTGPNCCRPAYIPKCRFSMTCDRTIDITEDKSTIVFGQSHEPHEFPRFRVYNHDPYADKWFQRGILPLSNGTLHRELDDESLNEDDSPKSRRVIASSVSISNDGQRVALGSNTGRTVKIFDLDNDRDEWLDVKTFTGPSRSLFGQAVSLNPANGNTIAIGTPRYTADGIQNSGRVSVYRKSQSNSWSKLEPNINGHIMNGELGWRVDIDKDNIVHAGYHKNAAVVSYRRSNNQWVAVNDKNSDLQKCFTQQVINCESSI